MIHLIDGTEWSFEDLERHNKAKADEVEKQRIIRQRQKDVANHIALFLGREKVSDVGKPLNK